MPRGKTKPADIQVSELVAKKADYQTKIDNYKKKIADIDLKIRSISDRRELTELKSLNRLLKEKGLSTHQLTQIITSDNAPLRP